MLKFELDSVSLAGVSHHTKLMKGLETSVKKRDNQNWKVRNVYMNTLWLY